MLPHVVALCPTFGRPACLFNVIQCFIAQKYHGMHELLILDDHGDYDIRTIYFSADGLSRIRMISLPEEFRFRTLPEKFNALVGLAGNKAEVYALWEDDDVYLPWHLEQSVENMCDGVYYPPVVLSSYGYKVQREKTGGRFHASLVFGRACYEHEIKGWPITPAANFDQVMIKRCVGTSINGCFLGYGDVPSYLFQWETSEHVHGQGMMNGPDDRGWYHRFPHGDQDSTSYQRAVQAVLNPEAPIYGDLWNPLVKVATNLDLRDFQGTDALDICDPKIWKL